MSRPNMERCVCLWGGWEEIKLLGFGSNQEQRCWAVIVSTAWHNVYKAWLLHFVNLDWMCRNGSCEWKTRITRHPAREYQPHVGRQRHPGGVRTTTVIITSQFRQGSGLLQSPFSVCEQMYGNKKKIWNSQNRNSTQFPDDLRIHTANFWCFKTISVDWNISLRSITHLRPRCAHEDVFQLYIPDNCQNETERRRQAASGELHRCRRNSTSSESISSHNQNVRVCLLKTLASNLSTARNYKTSCYSSLEKSLKRCVVLQACLHIK